MGKNVVKTKIGLLARKEFGAGAIQFSKIDAKEVVSLGLVFTLTVLSYRDHYLPGTEQELHAGELINHWLHTRFGIDGNVCGTLEEDGSDLPVELRGALEYVAQKHLTDFLNCHPCVTVRTHRDHSDRSPMAWFEITLHHMLARKPDKLLESIMKNIAKAINP